MDIDKIVESMEAIVSAAEAEDRSMNEDEITKYEGLERDLQAARKTAEIQKRQKAYKSPIVVPTVVQAIDKGGDEVLERAFEAYLRTGVKNADLIELRAQGEGTDSAGGYMVPTGFRQKITEVMKAYGGIQGVSEIITTTTGNPLPWPTLDDTSNEGEIVAEHGTGAGGADLVLGQNSLSAYKFMSIGAGNLPLRVSVELLQDSAFDIRGLVSRKLGERIGRAMAAKFATGAGSGSSEPEGLMNGSAGHTLAVLSTITYAELLAIKHAVDPAYRVGASWAFNDATLEAIEGLEDTNGRPLLVPSTQGIESATGHGTLLGYPIVVDQGIADLGASAKFAAFGNIREAFVIRRVRDVTLVVDPYSRAAYGQVEFTAWARADSLIQNGSAYVIVADHA